MRARVRAFTGGIVLALLPGWTLVQGEARQSPGSTGTISGRVVAALTDVGVPDAGVRLTPRGGAAAPLSTRADASGAFAFRDVPAGRYELAATSGGYIFGTYGQRRAGGGGRAIVVTAGAVLTGIAVPVWRFSSVSGRVVSSQGAPIPGVSVQAFRRTVRAGHTWPVAQGRTVETDDRGEYRIADLMHGSYLVAVNPGRAAPFSSYPTVLFPGARVPAAAQWLELAPGEDRQAIDVELPRVPTTSVRGRVLATSPEHGRSTLIRLVLADQGRRTDLEVAVTSSAAGGRFEFSAVPEGQYFVEAYPDSGEPAGMSGFDAPAIARRRIAPPGGTLGPIDVVTDSRTNLRVEIALHPPRVLAGRIVAPQNAEPHSLARLLLVAFTADGQRAVPLGVDASGRFRAATGVAPGRYVIRAGGEVPRSWHVERITAAGEDVTDAALVVSDRDVEDVVIRFGTGGSAISGTVAAANGRPDPEAAVLLFPADRRRWIDYGRESPRLRSARVAEDGTYAFSSLLPGEYLLVAIKDELAEAWQAEDRLADLSRAATPIKVDRDDRIVLDLRTTAADARQ